MAKRKITVTVDEYLVDAAQQLGGESLSGIVNAALADELDRRLRAAALARLLADWDSQFGPVPDETARWAAAAFDNADALTSASGQADVAPPAA